MSIFFKRIVTKRSFPLATGILIGAGLKGLYDEYGVSLVVAKTHLPSTNMIEKYGIPNNLATLHYSNHILQYDFQKRIPLWVSEHITKDTSFGSADRQQCNFKPDNNIPEKFRSRNEDYLNSGYDRGHMMPAADVRADQEAMSETFLLSNIVPQNSENNQGFWSRMEIYCRSLLKKYSDVYIISGPLFLPTEALNSKEQVVTYKVIGTNHIAVPTHLYKVVLAENNGKPVSIAAFVVPNKEINDEATLKGHQMPLERLEKLSGIEFFPKLRLKWMKDLCEMEGCKMLSKKSTELYHLTKRVKKATTVQELDQVFMEINSKKIQVNKEFMDLYWKKKEKLKNS